MIVGAGWKLDICHFQQGVFYIYRIFTPHIISLSKPKQGMQTCSTLIWSYFPNFLSDLSSICLQSTVWKCIQRVPPYPRANNTLSGLSDSKFDWRAWDCTQDYVWLWRLTDGTRSPYHLGLRSSVSKRSIRRFVTTEKAPTRAFSWLKAATTAFTFKTLLRHYAKQALTPRSLNVKLGPRRNYHKGRTAIRH